MPGTPTRSPLRTVVSVPRNATEAQIMTFRTLQIAAMWVFLGPLIIILGTVDVLTAGRSRIWLLGE
jgi:hypothetical protein